MRKIFIVLTVVFTFISLSFSLSGCSNNSTTAQKNSESVNELKIEMLDIGQGDSILIRTDTQVVLVDTGDIDEREHLVKLLKDRNISTIDKMIITHPHADHLGGAYAVFKNFTVKEVYDNGDPTTTKTYMTYLKNIKKKNIAYHQLKAGDELNLGTDMVFKVFSPTEKMLQTTEDLNNNSIVGQLRYHDFTMLFTGDCEREAEQEIVKTYGDEIQSLILKSPHHGSKTSSSESFLKAVNAQDVLISLGTNNEYGHPPKQTLNRYKKFNLNIYRTDTDGTITISSYGTKTYTIIKEKNKE